MNVIRTGATLLRAAVSPTNRLDVQRIFIANAPIYKVYFSLLHPTAGFGANKKENVYRKPRPVMSL
jgi:hypothetical protein